MSLPEGVYYIFNSETGRRIIPRKGSPKSGTAVMTPRRSDGRIPLPPCDRCREESVDNNDLRNAKIRLKLSQPASNNTTPLYFLISEASDLHLADKDDDEEHPVIWSDSSEVQEWRLVESSYPGHYYLQAGSKELYAHTKIHSAPPPSSPPPSDILSIQTAQNVLLCWGSAIRLAANKAKPQSLWMFEKAE